MILPWACSIHGVTIIYTDSSNDLNGTWSIKCRYIAAGSSGTTTTAFADASTSNFYFQTTGGGGVGQDLATAQVGSWYHKTFSNNTNYWPYEDIGTPMFEAGTKLIFQMDRSTGTVPSHTIKIHGWYDITQTIEDPNITEE